MFSLSKFRKSIDNFIDFVFLHRGFFFVLSMFPVHKEGSYLHFELCHVSSFYICYFMHVLKCFSTGIMESSFTH